MIRDRICNAIEKYIEAHRPEIHSRVEPKVNSTTDVLVERLPSAIMDFLTNKFAEDHNAMDGILDFVATVTERLPAKFKDKIRENIKEVVYESMSGVSDKVTDTVVNQSKHVVREATGQSDEIKKVEKKVEKKEKKDEKGEAKSFFSKFDLSWMFSGKEGIVKKILELLRGPIHHACAEVQEHLVAVIPKRVEEMLAEVLPRDADNDGKLDGFRGAVLGVFGQRDSKNNIFTKMVAKIPELVEKVVEPVIKELEEHIFQAVEKELGEEIFAEEKCKEGVTGILDKEEDGKKGIFGGIFR